MELHAALKVFCRLHNCVVDFRDTPPTILGIEALMLLLSSTEPMKSAMRQGKINGIIRQYFPLGDIIRVGDYSSNFNAFHTVFDTEEEHNRLLGKEIIYVYDDEKYSYIILTSDSNRPTMGKYEVVKINKLTRVAL